MAFAQQQIRPRHRSQPLITTEDGLLSPSPPPTLRSHVPSTSSDSETDWHVISTALRSNSSSDTSSLPPPPQDSSEPESFSSSFRPSDTESFSDLDFAFDVLPSHDGTGAFIEDETEEEGGLVLRNMTDFEPNSPSMPNILLPYGGIHRPSFVTNRSLYQQPTFQPTVNDDMVSSDASYSNQEEYNSGTTNSSADDQIQFTRKRPINLDSIPTHHPSFPGTITSFTILSAIWSNLRRLTNHLIENDTYTADAFTTLVSEATLEGCLPFGSHLHMELAAGIRPNYTNQGYEGLPGM
ncbi:hypothetical protein BC941DRAFT_440687 [Chlamydoabsidia padenii]|nr:hypothetical protein BC941DRAFT_440687 [Chlamydoabsidia padenii]